MSRRERYLATAALRRLRADEWGATAIAFAFVAPLAILLSMGALEIGRAVLAQARINHAAKPGFAVGRHIWRGGRSASA